MSDNAIPPIVAASLDARFTPMLMAVGKLGSRCTWGGQPEKRNCAIIDEPTCWLLDGERATPAMLFHAAGMDIPKGF